MVRRDQRIVLAGVVDDVAADRLVLWVEKGVPDFPPDRGQLIIDDRASRIAIDRQKGALDAVRYGRCLRPSLRSLILDPRQSRAPLTVDLQGVKWIQPAFDDDKKLAVSKALGAEDVLVVYGPPGTGKTVFITELVGQLLERDPGCKILLTSQTHVALDNALERCHVLHPAARLLRVAQRDDDRVSAKVQELTIDRVADRWRSDVAKASEEFLASAATEMGVSRQDIALGIAVGRLRIESVELDRIQTQLDECERILAVAEQQLAEAQVGHVADSYPETREEVDELREQAMELRGGQEDCGRQTTQSRQRSRQQVNSVRSWPRLAEANLLSGEQRAS